MMPHERMKQIEEQIKIDYVYMENVIWMHERIKKLTKTLEDIGYAQHPAWEPSVCLFRELCRKALVDE